VAQARGLVAVAIKAEYKGHTNEMRFYIAYAPDAYVKAMALADMLRPEAAELKHMTQSAALSGNWSAVGRIVKAAEGAYRWPIAKELALLLLSNYLEIDSNAGFHLPILHRDIHTSYPALVTAFYTRHRKLRSVAKSGKT